MEFSAKEILLKIWLALRRRPGRSLIAAVGFALFLNGNIGDADFFVTFMREWLGDDWPTVLLTSLWIKVILLCIVSLCLWQIGVSAKEAEYAAAEKERESIISALKPLQRDIDHYNRLRDIDRCRMHLDACEQSVRQAAINLDRLMQEGEMTFGDNSEFAWNDAWGTASNRGRLAAECLCCENIEFPALTPAQWVAQQHENIHLRIVVAAQNLNYLALKRTNNSRIEAFIGQARQSANEKEVTLLNRDLRLDR